MTHLHDTDSARVDRPPRWARAADTLVIVLVGLAAIVAISGGFRTRVADVRITFTSPVRLLIAAGAVALIRHLFSPTTPIYRHLPPRLAAIWARPGVRVAVAAFVGTRPAVILAGYLAIFLFGYPMNAPPFRVSGNEFVNLPVRWDAGWYLQIVMHGYSYVHGQPGLQQNVVFFPAYPAIVALVGLLFGNRELSYVLAGVVVSSIAWIAALAYVFALARDVLDDEAARYAVWLIAAYPFAVFFGAIYTESLFLLGVAGAVFHFTRGQYGRAGAWGLLVGLTRPNGFLLGIVLAVLAVAPWLPRMVAGGGADSTVRNASRSLRERGRALAVAAAPGAGALVYSAYVWWLTGDPLAWAEGHVAWGREYRGLSVLVTDRYDFIWHAGLYGYVAALPHDLLNALGVLFVLVAAWPVYRRLGLAYATFILINMLPPLAAGGLLSAGRFSSVLFPAFIWFAGWVPPAHRAGWIVSFAAIQALNAALFYTWRPLY